MSRGFGLTARFSTFFPASRWMRPTGRSKRTPDRAPDRMPGPDRRQRPTRVAFGGRKWVYALARITRVSVSAGVYRGNEVVDQTHVGVLRMALVLLIGLALGGLMAGVGPASAFSAIHGLDYEPMAMGHLAYLLVSRVLGLLRARCRGVPSVAARRPMYYCASSGL
jgi:hypothetical protein